VDDCLSLIVSDALEKLTTANPKELPERELMEDDEGEVLFIQ
jgi:hypothetical protein